MSDAEHTSDRIEQLARHSRRAAMVGAGGLLVFLLALGFGSYQVRQLGVQIDSLQGRADSLRTEIAEKRAVHARLLNKVQSLGADVESLRVVKQQLYETFARYDPSRAEQALASAVDSARSAGGKLVLWIQVGNAQQRERAEEMGAWLERKGFRVPGIETVKRLPSTAQIRVFHSGDAEVANVLRDRLASEGYEFTVHDLSGRYQDVDRGIIELWFPSPTQGRPAGRP